MQKRNSSLLELEAADYFKLDVDQVQQLSRSRQLLVYCDEPDQQQPIGHSTKQEDRLGAGNQRKMSPNKNIKGTVKSLGEQAPSGRRKNMYRRQTPSNVNMKGRASSSTTSSNSLPSISSSPSISPSLVCPHLNIGSILSRQADFTKSPHTIGLCAKCRLDPPPDVQSPLSPAFRPSLYGNTTQLQTQMRLSGAKMRRGFSDQHLNPKQRRRSQQESLDYSLEPEELRRLQMSPSLRNSVEFIRNNTTEAARVVRIYKNGEPFGKPLRISIMRGEFANLEHLLDHINSRQLVPSGARYLFHLDGQLVYSEHELKHGSIYIVSGIRNFDFRSNSALKSQVKQDHELRARKSSIAPTQQQPPLAIMERQRSKSDVQHPVKGSKFKDGAPVSPTPRASKHKPIFVEKAARGTKMRDTSVLMQAPRAPIKKKPTQETKVSSRTKAVASNEATESLSKSSENLEAAMMAPSEDKEPRRVLRAKSELSALPNKRKKNVTFKDTGRGSSPAISDLKMTSEDDEPISSVTKLKMDEKRKTSDEELDTSEVRIQVSDSIEGFLIDLPIPLSSKQEEEKRSFLRKGQGAARGPFVRGPNDKASKQRSGSKKPFNSKQQKVGKPKVVTIREKQLSFDEMDKFKDLDHGDHHIEEHKIQTVTINLDAASNQELRDQEKAEVSAEVVPVPDRSNTISIGQELHKGVQSIGDDQNDTWQYPGGRESSATPTERPVSQSEANESVRARVTTPTPSLSTVGDSTSLAGVSLDASGYGPQSLDAGVDRHRPPVMGRLRGGLGAPDRNFRLVWVNGLAINDQYPDNSVAGACGPLAAAAEASKTSGGRLLSPSVDQKSPMTPAKFKPSERFHNWLCHSRRHDELVYPAGCLVVLWSRWSNEQRYYANHSASVSALALASLDTDLAASAQVQEPDRGRRTGATAAQVHLWSLTSLDTLLVVDDNHFGQRRIFSLKLRNTQSDGCELTVGARDDRRLTLFVLLVDLAKAKKLKEGDSEDGDTKKKTKKSRTTASYVLQASRPIQSAQLPLLVLRLSNVRGEQPQNSAIGGQDPLEDVVLSFGRQHFQVWLTDRKRQSLNLLQSASKSGNFVESIVRASCLARVSPSELLLGDLAGNISLLLIGVSCPAGSDTKGTKDGKQEHRYSLELVPLVSIGLDEREKETLKLEDLERQQGSAVTCLARISESLFVSADSSCCLRFWRIERAPSNSLGGYNCHLINCLRLPRDLGFVSALVMSKFQRKQQVAEFYVASTSNAILFGSLQLQQTTDGDGKSSPPCSTMSVVFEGHESSAMDLVADYGPPRSRSKPANEQSDYFTCALDCKICKWSGHSLVWKSMLPSACASLAVHPTGFVLAVGAADGTVYILDKISGLLISYFPLTPVCINCLTYSCDGSLLAAGCSNGSIFILPVYERGLKYKKVSIFQSPHPVVSLQFSLDNRYILTSVSHGQYQELILWDLPNFRYMRDDVKLAADKIHWFDSICSGSEDVRAIWENANLFLDGKLEQEVPRSPKSSARRLNALAGASDQQLTNLGLATNLSCHRLVRQKLTTATNSTATNQGEPPGESLVIASDTRGYLRLFRYPCYDIEQGFYECRTSSAPVNCCRFLAPTGTKVAKTNEVMFVSSSIDNHIFLWKLC